eukprot:gene52227-32881_t
MPVHLPTAEVGAPTVRTLFVAYLSTGRVACVNDDGGEE